METKIKDIKIGVDMKNRIVPQYEWARYRGKPTNTNFYHNVVFEDEFEIEEFCTTRSSVYITVRSTNTHMLYYMRWWAMKDLLKNGVLNKGKFGGIFTMKHAWDYTTLVLFDPEHLKEGILMGPDWWDFAQPWEENND